MARNRWSPQISARKPIEALLCLLAALMGPAQLLPDLLALGAALENSHTVQVGSDGTGLHLVLSHERGHPGRPDYSPRHQPLDPAHRHGLAASFLCLVATNDHGEPEHSAFFASGSVLEVSRKTQKAPSSGINSLAHDSNAIPAGIIFHQHFVARLAALRDHGPPETIPRTSPSSTVLLI